MPRTQSLRALRARISLIEGGAPAARPRPPLRTSLAGIDTRFAGGGLPGAGLHGLAGTGAHGFAAFLLTRMPGPVAWCRPAGAPAEPYPPGFLGHGIDPASLLVVDCCGRAELLQAAEETLRCAGMSAVVAEGVRDLDARAGRRLHLAARTGATAGLLLFTEGEGGCDALALDSFWTVAPAPAPGPGMALGWRLGLARGRGARPGIWTVMWDAEANRLDLVSEAGDGQAGPRARQLMAG